MKLRTIVASAIAVYTVVGLMSVPAFASTVPAAATTALPAPFAQWHVTVAPDPHRQGATSVDFTSPTLRRRVHNTVYLPSDYHVNGAPSAVLYFLHGAVLPAMDTPLARPLAGLTGRLHTLALTGKLGPDGGALQTDLADFGKQRTRAHFLVAAPDTGQDAACQTCLWNNGRDDLLPHIPLATAKTVRAETFLDGEFIPLIQHLFNTRTDAGGRGIAGFSTGAVGAWLQALRHPDMFTFVAPISGAYDLLKDLPLRLLFESLGVMRDQGYGTSVTALQQWRRFNPADLIGNLRGAGATIVASSGDGCLSPAVLSDPNCRRYSPVLNPDAATLETLARNDMNQYAEPGVHAAGVKATFVKRPGVHGANNATVYAHDLLPKANAAFATQRRTSATFDYTSADHDFTVWGYTIDTATPSEDRFVSLSRARHDGTHFAVTGAGTITIATPGTFTPGAHYVIDSTGAAPQHVAADTHGRLHLRVKLPETATTRDITVVRA
ncbi:alpha/beta hydrolase-fold protein [Sciscionella sediminilitoris]|uniref:alpha/beta hydrolase-fold protein n=1 Tax=Sciscionella sediminilitoris TaxID=1445613 RepID=UPI0004DF2913|nr:alpha/beta hydrolase-fold protein [Sciscionella sp. SE31]